MWHMLAPEESGEVSENMKKVCMCGIAQEYWTVKITARKALLDTAFLPCRGQVKAAFVLFDLQSHGFNFPLRRYYNFQQV